MANPEHVEILKQGVEVWNVWRREHPTIAPDFSKADLKEVNLNQANLTGADFYKADLRKADFTSANLIQADISEANLTEATISAATFLESSLRGANLSGAILRGTNIMDTDLSNANLKGATLFYTNFSNIGLDKTVFDNAKLGFTTLARVDLSGAVNLETVEHFAPSFISIDTLYRTGARVPEVFLRRCGVPESFIVQMHALIASTEPIQFYSCFISHSAKDQRFCDRLFADLQVKGVRTWYFPEDARWGEPVWKEIDQSIKIYDKLVVVCSQHSLQSGPVLREIERSLNREDREDKSILFPIRIDNYIFDEWQHERKDDVLRKVIGDFRKWKNPESYNKAFERLLRDLKAEEKR